MSTGNLGQRPQAWTSTLNLVRKRGGSFTEARNPVAVLVRSPAEARRIIEAIDSGEAVRTPWANSCLKDQQPGDRAVVYESGKEGSGLVAWIDFCGPVADNDQWRHGAQSAMQRMSPEISRTELLEDPELRPILLHIRGQRWLSPEAASAISRRSPPPPFLWLPVDGTWDLSTDWDAADPGNAWGLESGMQKAVAADVRCRKALGLGSSPAMEIRSDDHRDRYDLIADGVVVEFKIAADLGALNQIDRYLASLRRTRPRTGDWSGHIVYCRYATRRLVSDVKGRRDVTLWRCGRDEDHPTLERIA